MLCRDKNGHLYIECEEIKPESVWWQRVMLVVCFAAAVYIGYHLIRAGFERHVAIERNERSGFVVTGPEHSSGHGYWVRKHERGR